MARGAVGLVLLAPLLLAGGRSEGRPTAAAPGWRAAMIASLLYPAPAVAVPSPPPAPLEEVRWRLPEGAEIVGWYLGAASAPAERPALLFFHGNGENLETLRESGFFAAAAQLGVPILAADYPGYGASGGQPSEASLLASARAAWDWLARMHGGRPKVVAGWSLGAAVAIQLAAERGAEIDGLVALSPWTSLREVAEIHFPGFLVSWLLAERYDSGSAAAAVRAPSLVVHGAGDTIIPLAQGRRLAAALGPACRFQEIATAGHNDLLGHPAVWRELAAFLDEVARGPAAAPGQRPTL